MGHGGAIVGLSFGHQTSKKRGKSPNYRRACRKPEIIELFSSLRYVWEEKSRFPNHGPFGVSLGTMSNLGGFIACVQCIVPID